MSYTKEMCKSLATEMFMEGVKYERLFPYNPIITHQKQCIDDAYKNWMQNQQDLIRLTDNGNPIV